MSWCELVLSGVRWWGMVWDDGEWCEMVGKGVKWFGELR